MCFSAKGWENSLPQYLLLTLSLGRAMAEILINGEGKKEKGKPNTGLNYFSFPYSFSKGKGKR